MTLDCYTTYCPKPHNRFDTGPATPSSCKKKGVGGGEAKESFFPYDLPRARTVGQTESICA